MVFFASVPWIAAFYRLVPWRAWRSVIHCLLHHLLHHLRARRSRDAAENAFEITSTTWPRSFKTAFGDEFLRVYTDVEIRIKPLKTKAVLSFFGVNKPLTGWVREWSMTAS